MKTLHQIALTTTQSLAVVLSLLALAPHAQATTETWEGVGTTFGYPGTDTNFNNANNWSNTVPGNGDSVYFNYNTTSETLTLSADVGTASGGLALLNLQTSGVGLDLQSSSGTYTLNMQSNSTIDFGSTNSTAAAETIDTGVTLNFTGASSNAVYFTDSNGGSLTINGLVTGTALYYQISSGTVTFANTGNTFNGTNGNVQLYLQGAAAFTSIANAGVASALGEESIIWVNGGKLIYTGSGADSTNKSLYMQNGATLSNTSATGGTLNWTGTIGNNSAGNANSFLQLTGTNSGVNTISGLISDGSPTAISGGSGTTGKVGVLLNGSNTWLLSNNSNSFSAPGQGYLFAGGGDNEFSTGVVNGGTLEFTSIANTGSVSALGAGTGAIVDGGTLAFVGTGAYTSNRTIVVGYVGGYNGSGTGLVANNATASTSTLTLTGTLYGSEGFNDTAYLGGSNTGSNTFSGQIIDGNGQTNGGINDHTALVKTGLGTWILTNANNQYSKGTTIEQGTLVAGASSTSTTGLLNVGTNGSNQITTTGTPFANGAAVVFNQFNAAGQNVLPTGITIGTTYYVVNAASGTFQVAATSGGTPITLGSGGAFVATQAGVFGEGTNTVTLGDANTANAPVTLLNAGYTVSNPITVSNNATTGGYTIGGSNTTGTSYYAGNIALNQAVTLQSATGGTTDFETGTWTTNNNAVTVGSSGNTGTVQLSNNLNTTAGVAVNYGTLNLASTSSTSAISVASGATLSGTGVTTGAVTVAGGGAINLQDGAIGTLHTGSLTIGGGTASALTFDIGASGAIDTIASSGGLTLAGMSTINIGYVSGTPTLATGNYTLISYTGAALTSSQLSSDFTLNTSALTGAGSDTFQLVSSAGLLQLDISGPAAPTTGTYTLAETTASNLLHVGATTTATTTLTNTGAGSADSVNYTGLGATAATGSITGTTASGGPVANGGGTAVATQTYTAETAGTDTVTPTASVTGVNAGTPVDTGTTTALLTVYSGTGTWNHNGGGSWGTTQTATQSATPWLLTGGTPGVTPGFQQSDSASFGTALTSGSATITLDGASPYLNAITFNDSNSGTSYTVAPGTGGTIHLDSTSTATITNAYGNNAISAPIELDSAAATSVAAGTTLTLSGTVSDSGTQTLAINGLGNTVLTSGNTYHGATTINSGTLTVSNGLSGSATGSGALTVGANGTLAGVGQINASSFTVNGKVIVGNGTDTTSQTTLTGSGPNSISNATLNFNISASTAGQGNVLNVGTSAIAFSNSTLALNLVGTGVLADNSQFVLIAGTGSGQYSGLTYQTENIGGLSLDVITSGLSLSWSPTVANTWYANNSVLFLNTTGGVDDIEVDVVPEPGTWALMLGGLAMLIFLQRARRKS